MPFLQRPGNTEHIALECDAPGQKLIWNLTQQLWSKKYLEWPTLTRGSVLGSNLVKFMFKKGVVLPEKGRLFAILVSTSWHLIWNMRHHRVIENSDHSHSINS
jgi:ribonuclease HI